MRGHYTSPTEWKIQCRNHKAVMLGLLLKEDPPLMYLCTTAGPLVHLDSSDVRELMAALAELGDKMEGYE